MRNESLNINAHLAVAPQFDVGEANEASSRFWRAELNANSHYTLNRVQDPGWPEVHLCGGSETTLGGGELNSSVDTLRSIRWQEY